MTLTDRQERLCEESPWAFSHLRALFLNCTLKPSPERSHTSGLIDVSRAIMEGNGTRTEVIRPVDHEIAFGVWPDMTEHGGPENDFTARNTMFMTWNLLHFGRMLRDTGGIPAHGNQRSEWEAGCRSDAPNPEHR